MTNEEYNALTAEREAKIYALIENNENRHAAIILERDKERAKTDKESKERQEKLDALFAEVEQEFKEVNERYGSSQRNLGDLTEEFFFKGLKRSKELGGIIYDEVEQNWKTLLKKESGEYDIVMINGTALAIIEVKTKGHINDLIKLKEKMLPRFKRLFPNYKDYKLYAGFASFFVTEDMKEFAKNNGMYILERNGDVIATTAENINYW